MNAIKKTRKLIAKDPVSEASAILSRLVRSLESEEKFELGELYKLNLDAFELAIEVLKEWRLDRYYMGKAKLHDMAVQVHALN